MAAPFASHPPHIAGLEDQVYLVNLIRGPAGQLHPVLEVGLLHRFALGEELAGGGVGVDFQDGGSAVGTPLAHAAGVGPQLAAEFFFGQSRYAVRG